MELAERIVPRHDHDGMENEVVTGSIPNPMHVLDAALFGGDIPTIPCR